VINDVTYRILLIILIVLRLDGKLIDLETAFFYGTLEEEIYMDCPDGWDDYRWRRMFAIVAINLWFGPSG